MFKCEDIEIEGVISEVAASKKAVVITHPHPLYGGNMNNSVVLSIAEAFDHCGYSSLRFNFRGTGASQGQFDDGNAEQKDVKSAIAVLQERGYEQIVLAGYSFGSRVNASLMASGLSVADHIMVSPPVAFMSFENISTLPDTGLIVTGKDDDIALPQKIYADLDRWGIKPVVEVIAHCDHFYSGCLKELETIICRYLDN